MDKGMFDWVGGLPDKLQASACFGTPVERGGRTLIPVARVTFGLGMGGKRESGGGGGGGGAARPLAIVEISDNDVQIHHIRDTTRIVLGSLALVGWNVYWITRAVRAFADRPEKRRPV